MAQSVVRLGGAEVTNLLQLEPLARKVLTEQAYGYYAGGAGDEETLRGNAEVFSRLALVPRMLRDVSRIDMGVTLFGHKLSFPVLVAPMALQAMAHSDGELATARAASSEGTAMVVSTMANYSIEQVAATGARPLFFQLYVLRARGFTQRLVSAAEASGYTALVVTVDAPRLGKRERDQRSRFSLRPGLVLANLVALEDEALTRPTSERGSALEEQFAQQMDESLTWEFLAWLKTVTRLPVLVKGVLHPDDARLAVKHGVDGIIVSNHGGRQVDTTISAVEALPGVAAAVAGRVPVLVDGGVRRGTDVYKCLALGATAVLLGRPCLYGLALGGQEGVATVLRMLRQELDLAMALMGTPTLQDIYPGTVLWRNAGGGIGGGGSGGCPRCRM